MKIWDSVFIWKWCGTSTATFCKNIIFFNGWCYKKSSRGSTFHKNHSYWRFGFSYQIHQNSVVPTRQAYFIFHFLEIILCRFSENIFVVPIFKLIFFSNSVSRAQNLKQWGSENQTLDIQKHSKTGDFTFCSWMVKSFENWTLRMMKSYHICIRWLKIISG